MWEMNAASVVGCEWLMVRANCECSNSYFKFNNLYLLRNYLLLIFNNILNLIMHILKIYNYNNSNFIYFIFTVN